MWRNGGNIYWIGLDDNPYDRVTDDGSEIVVIQVAISPNDKMVLFLMMRNNMMALIALVVLVLVVYGYLLTI